jgi:hypothetical protein
VTTEGGTSVARLPNPLGKDSWLRLHKLEARWYMTAPPEVQELTAVMMAASLERMGQFVKQADEAAKKSMSLEQFRHRLKALQAKYGIPPALGLAHEPGPRPTAKVTEGDKSKSLPAGHFRAEITNLLDPWLGSAVLQDLLIETPELAEVQLMLKSPGEASGGPVEKMEKRPGDAVARLQVRIFVDYLEGDKDRFQGNYLKFVLIRQSKDGVGSASYQYRPAPAGGMLRNLRLPLKRGVYAYTGKDSSEDKAIEVLAVGKQQLLLRVYKPEP